MFSELSLRAKSKTFAFSVTFLSFIQFFFLLSSFVYTNQLAIRRSPVRNLGILFWSGVSRWLGIYMSFVSEFKLL